MLTPYQFASNSLIGSIDLDGEESKVIVHTYGTDKTTPLFTPTTYVDNSIIAQEGVHYEVHHFKKINDGKVVGTTTCNYVVDDNTGEKLFLFGGLQAARNIMSSPFSPIKKNSEAGKMRDVDLGDEVPFVSQFTLPRPQVACCRASQQIIKNFGIPSAGAKSSRFIIGRENADKNAITPTSQAASGIEYINKQLEGGNPIMVGLNHTFGKGQGDGEAADHFVVIVGRFYDKSKKQYYFNFLEVGTSSEDNGRSDENRLYINKDNTITGTNYAGRRNFTVTDIRKNE